MAVTTVDSGSKALEFLGLQEEHNDQNHPNQPCVSPSNQQVIYYFLSLNLTV